MFFGLPEKISGMKQEKELLRQFSSGGDLEILGRLYSGYMHLVYGICLKYLGNREEAKDAVMQIFEKLITDIPKQKIGNFRSWLYVVVKNYCLVQIRSRKAKHEKYDIWAAENAAFMENSFELHPVDTEEKDANELLADCIERLREEQKKCIIQFYYEDKCYLEISKNLGMEVKKIKSHLQNGKRNLKLCLEKKYETEKQKRG